MKPGDHPDFFRFPAPEGRSRESTLRIDQDGRFWHDGQLVSHAPMRVAFARWLRRHPDDGRYILSNGYDWTYIAVDDVPFAVSSIDWSVEPPMLLLTDESREPLVPDRLRIGHGDALYAQVKGGEFEARFSRSAQLSLADAMEELPDGRLGVRLGELVYPLPDAPGP